MKKNTGALAGTAIIFAIVITAVFARYISPYDPFEQDFGNMFLSPSLTHPFGTDQYGRDVATRIIYGARYDLMIGMAVVSIHFVVGVTLGLVAGFYGGLIETVIMRLVDVMLSIPSIVLALTIAGFLGGGIQNVIIAKVNLKILELAAKEVLCILIANAKEIFGYKKTLGGVENYNTHSWAYNQADQTRALELFKK